ncbi:MAG: phage holin family protein, partial [Gammaproteobacteria bacterium]|nr:phage holin family protein [Gammaproteobacteria bacterium]
CFIMRLSDIKDLTKPFNINLLKFDFHSFKVETIAIMSSILTMLSTFSENYLGISGAFAMVLFVLLIVDFATGIAAARSSKEQITSRKGLRTLYKSGAYILFMYVAFSLHKELEGKAELFETVIKYFHIYIIIHVSFWELFSIDENLKKLNIDLGITDLLKLCYNNIKNIFTSLGKPKRGGGSSEYEEKDDLDN